MKADDEVRLFDQFRHAIDPKIEESWKKALYAEFQETYFRSIKNYLKHEKKKGKTIYPKGKDIFAAFNHTPLPDVKVVILGQDPYHGPRQANGLCFSVSPGIPQPPSLKNIFKEICDEFDYAYPKGGDLSPWAKQGVFLLNAILTVEAHQAASHQKVGWHLFTDRVIETINRELEGVVFMLWGRFAQSKDRFIDGKKHHILKSPHPSPLSAHRGFLGNGHFKRCNEILQQQGKTPINWQID